MSGCWTTSYLLEKGSPVHVIGRRRVQRYTGADGVERQAVEIVTSKAEAIIPLPEFQLFLYLCVRQGTGLKTNPDGHI